jgi:hypothetical protein
VDDAVCDDFAGRMVEPEEHRDRFDGEKVDREAPFVATRGPLR